MKRYTAGFLFTDDGQFVVLVQKNKPEWQRGLWNAIGGKVEDGETPLECMRREFKEECVFGAHELRWEQFATLRGADWEVHFFRAFHPIRWHWTDKNYGLETEVVKIWNVRHLPGVIPNLHYLVPMALHQPLDPTPVLFEITEVTIA